MSTRGVGGGGGRGYVADRRDAAALELLLVPLAALIAFAGCNDDDTSVGAGTDTAGVWSKLNPGTLDAAGGAALEPGGHGAPGGNIDVSTRGAVSFGTAFGAPADPVMPPADAMRITTLDADAEITGTAVIDHDMNVGGDGARRLTVRGGDLYIAAGLRGADTAGAGRALTIEAPDGTIYVSGAVDLSGAHRSGQPGGALAMSAARIVVSGTLSTAGGDGDAGAAAGGDIRITSTGDVMLLGTVRARGGAVLKAAGAAQGGAAASLAIDAAGNVQLGGVVDMRGGFMRGAAPGAIVAAGAGGRIAIGGMTAPASVTFALDVSLDGGDGRDATGGGGNVTLLPGGDFSLSGSVRSNGGAIAEGGVGDGGLAGNFTLDINNIIGNQVFQSGGSITLDGGGSGGMGIAGGGGHLYARSYDGTVTMSGKLYVRGGAARDPGGKGGLGGHVNIFSDSNHDGVGGNLTIMPDGLIDASGGAGEIGGDARNDGTPFVATFPDNQEMIAVLLNADGIHGTPMNGIIDNQGMIITRGGSGNGAGGDIAFHGEGTGGLHDPLSGNLQMDGAGAGVPGQFASE